MVLASKKCQAADQEMFRHLGVEPGSVTPFALINDTAHQVRLALDRGLAGGGTVNAHPLVNTMTTSIARDDLVKFLESTGHPPRIVRVAGLAGPADD